MNALGLEPGENLQIQTTATKNNLGKQSSKLQDLIKNMPIPTPIPGNESKYISGSLLNAVQPCTKQTQKAAMLFFFL